MADRTVVVQLRAEVGQYKSAMNQAAASTERVGAAAKKSAATTTAAAKQQASAATAGANATAAATKKSAAASKTAAKATTDHVGALKSMGVMIGALGLAKFAKDSVSAFQTVTGEVAKMRRVTGGAPEDVSRLRSSLKMAGIDTTQFTKSAGLLSRKLVEAGKTSKGTAEMNKMLGTSFKDAQGNILPLTELLPRVGDTFKNMKDGPQKAALALTLFGRSGQAMLPWLNRGEAGIRELMAATSESAIVSDAQIKKNAELLASQRRLDEAMTGLKMSFGEALVPVLTEAAKVATTLSNAFTSLSPELRTATIYVAGAALAWKLLGPSVSGAGRAFGAIGGLIGRSTGMLTANAAAAAADTAATNANTAAQRANTTASGGSAAGKAGSLTALGRTAIGVAGVTTAILAGGYAYHEWIQGAQRATEGGDALTEAAAASGGALTDQSRAAADAWLQTNNLSSSYTNLGVSSDTMRLAVLGNKSAMDQVNRALAAQSGAQSQFISTGAGASAMMTSQGNTLGVLQDKLNGAYDSTKQYAEAAEKLRQEQQALAETNLTSKLDQAREGFQLGSIHAQAYARQVAEAGRAAGKTDQEIGNMLRGIGATPREVKIALSADPTKIQADIDTARNGLNNLKQFKKPEIRAEVKGLYGQLDAAQREFDRLKQKKKPDIDAENRVAAKVRKILDQIATVKQRHKPDIDANASPAKGKIAGVGGAIDSIKQRRKPKIDANTSVAKDKIAGVGGAINALHDKEVTVTVKKVNIGGNLARGGPVLGFDDGGKVSGPGTKMSDSIPAMLSNGEYVIRASAVDKYGVGFFDRVNAGRYAKGGRAPKKTYKQKLAEWNARNTAYESATTARNERISNAASAQTSRTSGVESTRSSFRGNSGVMTFDFGAYESARQASTNAIKAESDATAALFEARRKANSANRADRPQALRDLAAAQRTYADAARESAEATEAEAKAKPTSANILANFRDRVTKMQGLAGNLRTLAAWGMPSILLAEILNSGLESGSQMAAALVEGGPGDIAQYQSLAALQTFAATDLGNLNAAWNPGGGDLTLDQELANANAAIGPAPKGPGTKPVAKKKKKRALGGNVSRGEPYLVGERGMEMFVPGVSGTIVPARQLQTITANSGGGRDLVMSGPVQINLDGQGVWNGMLTANRRTGFTLRSLDGSN